jgi:hypothetical protein
MPSELLLRQRMRERARPSDRWYWIPPVTLGPTTSIQITSGEILEQPLDRRFVCSDDARFAYCEDPILVGKPDSERSLRLG